MIMSKNARKFNQDMCLLLEEENCDEFQYRLIFRYYLQFVDIHFVENQQKILWNFRWTKIQSYSNFSIQCTDRYQTSLIYKNRAFHGFGNLNPTKEQLSEMSIRSKLPEKLMEIAQRGWENDATDKHPVNSRSNFIRNFHVVLVVFLLKFWKF